MGLFDLLTTASEDSDWSPMPKYDGGSGFSMSNSDNGFLLEGSSSSCSTSVLSLHSANTLKSLSDILGSDPDSKDYRTFRFFQRRIDNGDYTLEDLIYHARLIPETYPGNTDASTKAHWRRLCEALDDTGYIWHGFSEQAFHIGKLLKAIAHGYRYDSRMTDEDGFISGLKDLKTNEQYENYHPLTTWQRQQIVNRLKKVLPGREYNVINYRYGLEGDKPMTLGVIGERLGGISKERVRQIEFRTLRRLYETEIDKLTIIYRYNETNFVRYAEEYESTLTQLETQKADLKHQLDQVVSRIRQKIAGVDEQINETTQVLCNLAELPYDKSRDLKKYVKEPAVCEKIILIEDVGFSTRTYNCLARRDIHTLGDIMEMRKEYEGDLIKALYRIRNMGKRGVEEIVMALKGYGYDVPGWEKVLR